MPWCMKCNRQFATDLDFKQHTQSSKKHVATVPCPKCHFVFIDLHALSQHVRDSPNHQPRCVPCNRDFVDEEAVEQHIRGSTLHANEKLNQGTMASPKKKKTKEKKTHIHLEKFFLSFSSFPYDPNRHPSDSFRSLSQYHGWWKDDIESSAESSAESSKAWEDYQRALEDELREMFGNEDDIEYCLTLCRALGIKSPPSSP